jgi:hypothetical protein
MMSRNSEKRLQLQLLSAAHRSVNLSAAIETAAGLV